MGVKPFIIALLLIAGMPFVAERAAAQAPAELTGHDLVTRTGEKDASGQRRAAE